MLEIKNLTGGYVHVPVLKDVSFTVESGQLVGLIGLNGAGKSTTINEIIGLLTPYSGEIKINGLTLREDATNYRKQIGYIPETPSLYEELTLREHIETVAMAYGIDQKVAFERVEPLLKMFRLQLLEVEKQKGKSILMSTHVLDSAEKMCDAFVILHKGEVRAQGNLQQLREAFDMPEASLNDIYLALTKEEEL